MDIDKLIDEEMQAIAELGEEAIDDILRSYGYDPDQLGLKSRALTGLCLENVRLKTRINELEKERNELLREIDSMKRG